MLYSNFDWNSMHTFGEIELNANFKSSVLSISNTCTFVYQSHWTINMWVILWNWPVGWDIHSIILVFLYLLRNGAKCKLWSKCLGWHQEFQKSNTLDLLSRHRRDKKGQGPLIIWTYFLNWQNPQNVLPPLTWKFN